MNVSFLLFVATVFFALCAAFSFVFFCAFSGSVITCFGRRVLYPREIVKSLKSLRGSSRRGTVSPRSRLRHHPEFYCEKKSRSKLYAQGSCHERSEGERLHEEVTRDGENDVTKACQVLLKPISSEPLSFPYCPLTITLFILQN